ncbi:ABC transporter permease [Pseudogracilibacillus sp. SE30717A]|uniref:ABC transporter permease n=1 Tax=Pseudogracilibacillus sp. SE30717A TaxID=3098293 RepID=UPI00300E63DE
MGRDLIIRIITIIIQVIIVASIVFSAIRFMPGDPAVLVLGTEKGADPEAVAEMRETLGLNQPFVSQYFDWMKSAATLDFGQSIFTGEDVTESIMERLPKTLELAFLALLIASFIGIPLGIAAALKRGSIADSIVSTLAAVGISFPVYIIGTFLILLLSFKLNLLPASGYVSFSEDPVDHLKKMALPALTLSLALASTIARMTRSSMLEVLNKDFIQTLRAKGLNENKVIFKHAFRNAIIAVITVIGLELGNLIGGTVLIEYLFNYPGLSSLLIQSINNRDYPLIQGSIVLIATLYILINLFVEILYGVMDPRTRKQ